MALSKAPNRKGVTLAELVFASAVIVIFSLVVVSVLGKINKSIVSMGGYMRAQSDLQNAHRHMSTELRHAKRSTVVLTAKPNEPAYSQIEFINVSGVQVRFYQQGGDLVQEKGTQVNTIIRDGLNRLTFSYPDFSDESRLQVSISAQLSEHGQGKNNIGLTNLLFTLDHI